MPYPTGVTVTRAARFAEFVRRLSDRSQTSSSDAAFSLIASTLNEVEDELSGVPNNPDSWQSDGRLYPPQMDSRRAVPDYPDVTRYRSRAHNTFIASNGAIEIVSLSGEVVLQKPGADGRHVWDTEKSRKS
jgi:hypothetical protein